MTKLVQKRERIISWKDLQEALREGSSGLIVGDEFADVELKDGQRLTFQVAWLAEDRTSVKLISKNCLAKAYQMNRINTNKGGFPATDLFKQLQTEIFDLLPDDLAAIVAEENRRQIVDGQIVEYSCNLWLPSLQEIFGYNPQLDEGSVEQFPIFTDKRNIRKSQGTNKIKSHWWCEAPYLSSTHESFCGINMSGNILGIRATHFLGVPVCLTIR